MNYFQELLDSYDRLKKRTFKLVYIEEAAGLSPEGINKANEYINTALASQDQKFPVAGLNLQVYFSKDKQEVMMDGEGVGAYPKAITQNGQPAQGIQGQRGQNYSQFVNMISGGQTAPQAQETQPQATSEAEQAYQMAVTPGNQEYLVQLPEPLQPELQKDLFLQIYQIKKTCIPKEQGTAVPSYCDELGFTPESKAKIGTLAIGSSQKSFEKKIVDGLGFTRNAETGQITKTEALSYDQRKQAVDGWKQITQVLTDPSKVDCNKVKNTIRISKSSRGDKIVFGSINESLEKSIVTSVGSLEKKALSEVQKHCNFKLKKVDLTVAAGNKYTIRGTFFEKSTNFAMRMRSIQRLKSQCTEKNSKACSVLDGRIKKLAEDIYTHKETVQANALTTEQTLDIASTTEYQAVMDILREHQSYDDNAIARFFARETMYAEKLARQYFPNAVGVIDSSLNPKTGDRADRKVLYLDAQAAQNDMSKFGASITPVKIGDYLQECSTSPDNSICSELSDIIEDYNLNENSIVYLGDLGLKRLTNISGGLTAGSFSGARRLHDYLSRVPLEQVQNGQRISQGYLEKIDEIQQIKPGDARDAALLKVEKNINETLGVFTAALGGNVINSPGAKGENALKDLNKPSLVAERLKKILENNLDRKVLQDSGIAELLKSDRYKSEKSRNETVGKLMRAVRHHLYRKEMTKNPEATTDALLRRLYVTGANKTELVQSLVDDRGNIKTINHNQIFRNIEEAKKTGRLQISIKGSSTRYLIDGTLICELSEDVDITSDGKSTHKFSVSVTEDGVNSVNQIPAPQIKESTEELIKQFIGVQQKLMEAFNLK